MRRAAGLPLGPLAGVPFTVKESTAVEGAATTFGVERFRGLLAPADAPPVARLRAAGAVPIGHSNIPTLILAGMHTRSELFGDTVNPWDPGRTPGGSSGGDGAAVATGMAALGLGNDSGGSVRIPAQFCGVAGLKPTSGRFPADHRVLGPDDPGPASQFLVTDGPLARTVADLRLAYEVLAGTDPRDPRAVPVPAYGEPLPGPVKVAVVADPGGHGVHPAIRAAVEAAAEALRDAGYDVREVPDVPRLDEALEAYGRITVTEFAPTWPVVRGLLGEGGDRYIAMAMERTPPANADELVKLMGTWLNIRRSWAEFLDAYPLLLGPVFTEPPVEPGLESRDRAGRDRVATAMRLCTVTSFVGVPSVAVPTGVAAWAAVRGPDRGARVPRGPVPGGGPGRRGPARGPHPDRPARGGRGRLTPVRRSTTSTDRYGQLPAHAAVVPAAAGAPGAGRGSAGRKWTSVPVVPSSATGVRPVTGTPYS